MHRSILFSIAAAATLAVSTQSAAEPMRAEARVAFADLNLASEAGAEALLARINVAARAVCGDRAGPMPLAERRAVRACMNEAVGQAVASIESPSLAYAHARGSNRDATLVRIAAR